MKLPARKSAVNSRTTLYRLRSRPQVLFSTRFTKIFDEPLQFASFFVFLPNGLGSWRFQSEMKMKKAN
jgi:hypothetical protein